MVGGPTEIRAIPAARRGDGGTLPLKAPARVPECRTVGRRPQTFLPFVQRRSPFHACASRNRGHSISRPASREFAQALSLCGRENVAPTIVGTNPRLRRANGPAPCRRNKRLLRLPL